MAYVLTVNAVQRVSSVLIAINPDDSGSVQMTWQAGNLTAGVFTPYGAIQATSLAFAAGTTIHAMKLTLVAAVQTASGLNFSAGDTLLL